MAFNTYGPKRIRTAILLIAKQALYQLELQARDSYNFYKDSRYRERWLACHIRGKAANAMRSIVVQPSLHILAGALPSCQTPKPTVGVEPTTPSLQEKCSSR